MRRKAIQEDIQCQPLASKCTLMCTNRNIYIYYTNAYMCIYTYLLIGRHNFPPDKTLQLATKIHYFPP